MKKVQVYIEVVVQVPSAKTEKEMVDAAMKLVDKAIDDSGFDVEDGIVVANAYDGRMDDPDERET